MINVIIKDFGENDDHFEKYASQHFNEDNPDKDERTVDCDVVSNTSTTQNSETKNILSQPKYGIESKSSTTATDDQQAPIHDIVRP